MTVSSNYDLVRASLLAAELTDEQCNVLSGVVQRRALKDGELLIREGHVDHSLYVVVEGQLAVAKSTDGGGEEVLHVLKKGELAGAMGFIDGLDHSATLRSIGESAIFTLDRDKFELLIATHPLIVYRVMRAIIRGVHAIVRRMNNQYVQLTNYITKQHGRY